VHATFNLLEPSAAPALAEAHEAGLGVVVKEGVANGRLTARTDLDDVRRILGAEAERLQSGMDTLALAWILARPFVDVVLSGATTVEQLHSNLAAAALPLPDVADAALTPLARDPAAYWEARAGLSWT